MKVPTGWAEWAFHRYFLLLSQAPIGFQEINPGGPASIEEMVTWLRNGKAKVGTALTVPGIGPVTAIAMLQSRPREASRYILAAPTSGCEVEFRFFVTDVSVSKQIVVESIPSSHLSDGLDLEAVMDEDCTETDPRGTRTDLQPTFVVTETERGSGAVDFLRVLVEEGNGRWVYIIGLDERRETQRAESLLLATDTADYTHCHNFRYPPQIVPISMDMQPFQALVETEPSHFGYLAVPREGSIEAGAFYEEFGREPAGKRPTQARLVWTDTDGFVVEPIGGAPATQPAPRFVVIDKAGEIRLHTPKRRSP
jgi:hypothetical protein